MSVSLWLTDQNADIQPATGVYKRAVLGGRGDNPSLVRSVTATVAGPTSGVQVTRSSGGTALAWLTDPLDGTDLTAAAWTLHAWARESDAAANAALRLVISKWTTSASATVLDDTTSTTELTTTMADYARTTAVATATTMADGDRLLFTIFVDDAASSLGASQTVTLSYGGTYPRAEGDTYLVCPDNLALTAALPTATMTSIRRVLREEQVSATEAAVIIRDDEIVSAFDRAMVEYNRLRPRTVLEPLSGDGSTYDYPLPSGWIVGYSNLARIEHPTGDQYPTYLAGDDWGIYESVLGRQPIRYLRFLVSAPASGTDNVLLSYTTRHVHTDEMSTVPPNDLEAICWLAAAWVAEARMADEADSVAPTINADVVNYREGVTRWARVASRLRDRFEKYIGVSSDGVPAAGAFVDWDVPPQYGGDFLFHSEAISLVPTTARLVIDRKQFDDLLKRLDAERLAKPIKDGMREGSGELIEEVRRIIEPTRDTGATKGSYKFDMKGSNLTQIQGRVYSDLLSAEMLEVGRKPGRPPPVDVIFQWARRKLGIADMGIAFAIARAIGREGSPKRRRGGSPQPYHQLEEAAINKGSAMRDAMLRLVKKAL